MKVIQYNFGGINAALIKLNNSWKFIKYHTSYLLAIRETTFRESISSFPATAPTSLHIVLKLYTIKNHLNKILSIKTIPRTASCVSHPATTQKVEIKKLKKKLRWLSVLTNIHSHNERQCNNYCFVNLLCCLGVLKRNPSLNTVFTLLNITVLLSF